jgi:hypothetical protein
MNIASKLMAQMLNGKETKVPLYRVDGDVIYASHPNRKKVTYTIERMADGFKLTTFLKGRYSHANRGTASSIASWVPVPEDVIQALPELEDKTPEVKVVKEAARYNGMPPAMAEPYGETEEKVIGGRLPGKATAMEAITGTKQVEVKPNIAHKTRRYTKTHERKFYYRCPGQAYPNSVMATSEAKARAAIREHEQWHRLPNGTEVWEASE